MAPFYGWGSTASRLEPLRGGSLLFTTKFPEVPGSKGCNLRASRGLLQKPKSEKFRPPATLLWFHKTFRNLRGGWPSGLRRCNPNRKVAGSNPTRPSARLMDPTRLPLTFGLKLLQSSD